METIATTEQTNIKEITKESVEAAAEAYAENLLGELAEPYKSEFKKKIKINWYAGFLAHAQMISPHQTEVVNNLNSLMKKAAGARDFIAALELYDFACEAGPLTLCEDFINLKKLI